MAAKYPIRYDFSTQTVRSGDSWLTVTVENLGDEPLIGLSARLNSLDTYSVDVQEPEKYLADLAPGEEAQLHYRITAQQSSSVYVSLDGRWAEEPFHWESPARRIVVGEEMVELVSFFALTEPRQQLGQPITCEARLRGVVPSAGLILEFWLEKPSGESVSLAKVATEPLAPGETTRYTAEFTPEEEGIYVLHAYLFDDLQRIGHAVEYVSISL